MNEGYGITAPVAELVKQRGGAAGVRTAPRGRVRTLHAGSYASARQGRGMEFDESRVYQPGDDVRAIDWRVTARTGRVHTKLFHEERERPVLLLVDQRAHMRFGTRDAFKSVVAARAAATLAWAAHDGGDRVGALILAGAPLGESFVTPQRSRARLLSMLGTISDATSREQSTDGAGIGPSLAEALSLLSRTSRPGTLLYLISDFADLDAEAERQLMRLARRCEVACVLVFDRLEAESPAKGQYRVSDGTRVLELPSASRRWRAEYAARFAVRRDRLETLCRQWGMAFFPHETGRDCAQVLRPSRTLRTLRAPFTRSATSGGVR